MLWQSQEPPKMATPPKAIFNNIEGSQMTDKKIQDKDTYYTLQIALAKVAKKALNDFCGNEPKTEYTKQIINKITLLTLGDLDQLNSNILEVCKLLNIDPATATINQFIEMTKKRI